MVVSNPQGLVCWDLTAQGPQGCNGPGGNRAGSGALIQRTNNGRTEFSVDDRTGNFRDNEGYFGFERPDRIALQNPGFRNGTGPGSQRLWSRIAPKASPIGPETSLSLRARVAVDCLACSRVNLSCRCHAFFRSAGRNFARMSPSARMSWSSAADGARSRAPSHIPTIQGHQSCRRCRAASLTHPRQKNAGMGPGAEMRHRDPQRALTRSRS